MNHSIVAKEHIRANGERIYLELAPVDPHSLMQGDYMALRFAIARDISTEASGSAALLVQRFQGARYGVFRVDRDSGEAVLVGLADKDLAQL